jgi:hypothetical protein
MCPFVIDPNYFMIIGFKGYLEGLPSVAFLEVTGRLRAIANICSRRWIKLCLKESILEKATDVASV